MPGVPLDGDTPTPDPNASYPMPPNDGKVRGGFFRTLLGTKRYEEEEQRKNHAEWVMNTLKDISTGASQAPDSIVKLLVREAGSTFGPEFGARLKEHFDQVNAEKALNAKRALLTQTPQPMGVPATKADLAAPPAAPAPVAPATPPQQPGGFDGGFSPVGGPPQATPPPNASAMAQRLMPLMQPQQQQQPQPPPGMPPPPNSGGTDAGPVPAQNATPAANPVVKEMSVASTGGGAGFGVPPPAPAPAQPQLPPPSQGSIFNKGPVQLGVDLAATALPTAQQANVLALQHAGAISRQNTNLQIEEANRKMRIVEADPNFAKLPPLQQQEVRLRIMGVQGAINNIQRPMNLPKSQIHGPEIPEGALGIDGRPINRAPGKWYQQQQDPASGDIRYYSISPAVTTTEKITAAGPVLVSIDHAGNIVKVAHSVDGSEIVDPRLLATVNTSMGAVPVVTKDENGDPVTTWVMKEGSTSSQKAFKPTGVPQPPGGAAPQGGGAAAPQGAAPAQGGGAAPKASTGPRGVNLPPTLARADPGTTYNSVQYARTTQKRFPKIDKLIADLESTGDLGAIASRWNEFKAGKIGAGDPRYAALRANMGMLSTALTVIHKTRGIKMAEHFQELADEGKMNAETFKSAYNELKEWVNDYATMGAGAAAAVKPGGGASTAAPSQLTPPPPSNAAEYLKSIGH